MNYLNKLGNYVSKGVAGIKGQFQGNLQNDYADRGVSSFENYGNNYGNNQMNEEYYFRSQQQQTTSNFFSQPQENKQPSSSLSAFLLGSTPVTNYSTMPDKTKEVDKEFIKDFKLIRGESVISWENCEIKIESLDFPCKLLLTNYRVYIVPNYQNFKSKYDLIFPQNYFKIPIHYIQSLELGKERTKNFKMPILITVKDQRVITILFKMNQGNALCSNLLELVNGLQTPSYLNFAKKYNMDYHPKNNGWLLYDPYKEYQRQGVTKTSSLFRITNANTNYTICETYPKVLVCPASITDDDYRKASEFRTKCRVPTLSYFYYQSKGSIWRSSQVKGGIMSNRNIYDERLINAITLTNDQKKIAVYDCRPYLSAYANKLKGAGPESVDNYHSADLVFCNIDNIHAARNALKGIYSYMNSDNFNEDKNFMSKFDSTKWTEFIFLLIKKSIQAAKAVRDGLSVLIHCSDGWDRASQMTAFTQVFIDPYFRTMEGYMVLIEKDFLSFGHQFKARNGYYDPKTANENQVSPVFLQYLDATSQVLVQYPIYFEFNMKFLVFIANHINSGKYGTFLFNNERERDIMKAKTDFCSIWSDILDNKEQFLNELYDPKTKEIYCFTPNFSPHQIRFWSEFFMQNCQLNFTYNYENLINRRELTNIVAKLAAEVNNKDDEISNFSTISSYDYYYDTVIKQKKKINKIEGENKVMRSTLYELINAGIINENTLEGCSEETKALIQKLKNEKSKLSNVFDFMSKNPQTKPEIELSDPVQEAISDIIEESKDKTDIIEESKDKPDESEEKIDG
ncbi:MAG: hypothetical protein MJ252_14160 [archaeon]|nr:hypothetical protein [archaeon]